MSNFDINSPEFNAYLIELKSEAVDACDGVILSPGQVVIRSPFNESLVSADTPDHRRLFAELEFAWDEPTRNKLAEANKAKLAQEEQERINRVKAEVDKQSKMFSYGNIRSVDIAYELKMSVSVIEDIFETLVQTHDYYFDKNSTDSTGAPCKVIVKRR